MNIKSYNPDSDKFNDGSWIIWYIWMDIKDVTIGNYDYEITDIEPYMSVQFFGKSKKKFESILCPIDRYCQFPPVEIKINTKSTVRQVLQKIKDFYNEEINKSQINPDDTSDYAAEARKKNSVVRYKLLGNKGFITGDPHPLLCCGLVRYEGAIYYSDIEKYILSLGS